MDNERTADVLQVALASYDRKELRVQKNYLEEQNPVLACTCFLNGHKLLQELQQGHNFDIVVLCSQMEDMSSIEFMMELRKLEHKPLLMLFDEGPAQEQLGTAHGGLRQLLLRGAHGAQEPAAGAVPDAGPAVAAHRAAVPSSCTTAGASASRTSIAAI